MRTLFFIILATMITSCSLEDCKCTTYLNGEVYSIYEYTQDPNTGCLDEYSTYTQGDDVFEEICN